MIEKSEHNKQTLGWGAVTEEGSEIWDTDPIFRHDTVSWKEKITLLFYPKKLVLFLWIWWALWKHPKDLTKPFRILDVGCGTGAAMIEMKKLFGKRVDIVGVDVVHLQVDLAKQKIQTHGVWAAPEWYDGQHLSYDDASFDAVYTSDVLGHVEDVPAWLGELARVLKPGGILAMFSESKLGKHAVIRNYLYKRGLNVDPHAEYHISLFSKTTLRELLDRSGFDITCMWSTLLAKFFVHPDELYTAFQHHGGFFFLRHINALLYTIKKKLHPYSTAAAELYSLFEMVLIGWWVESQGYVILAKKRKK